MILCKDFFYLSADGQTNIHAVQWVGEDKPRAVIQIAHGICEYIERYDHFARWLAEKGFVVVGNDHLGHGKSWQDPARQGLFRERDGWNTVLCDLETLRRMTAEEYPGVPYVLLGHSMGSFLARTWLIKAPGLFDGAIISGTGQQAEKMLKAGYALTDLLARLRGPYHRSGFAKKLMFGAYNKPFRPNRTDFDWICGNDEVVDAYCQDPGCQFLPCVSLYRDMLGALLFLGQADNLSLMDKQTPVLFFSGEQDPVGEMGAGVERVYQGFLKAGCADVQCRLYPDGRHEVLNEQWRETVYQDVLDWMEGRL